jgi:beta-ribofuranosylaminobenzene 5'-phosphate synthase
MIIKTSSRLHLTLIDMNGSYGRIDGGVGLTIKEPQLILEANPNDKGINVDFAFQTDPKEMEDYQLNIRTASEKIINHIGLDSGFDFKIHKTFPRHAGLGSGTQLSLAVGASISQLTGNHLTPQKIAEIVDRGGTSGIGVAAFDKGGFIVDGGHHHSEKTKFLPSSASSASPPPILARYDFPEEWKILIFIPHFDKNVSGTKEVNIFKEYCPLPLKMVQELSHLILMKMMPAVLEKDLEAFGEAVDLMQNMGFKQIENKLQNPIIGELMDALRYEGASGVGMSSFGPTIYAITDKKTKNLEKTARNVLKTFKMEYIVTEAQNQGVQIY